jgi:hypothetical protein
VALEFFHDFQNHPNFFYIFSCFAGGKRAKRGVCLVPQSNISYKTIKSNKTLFDCVGKDCFEVEEEKKEEIKD